MSDITWPTDPYLPLPMQGFSGTRRKQVLVTQMDSGRRRQRLRCGALEQMFKASWTFTQSQYEAFQEFFDDDLYGGTLEFILPLPRGNSGEYINTAVRFLGGEYDFQILAGGHTSVSARLDQMPGEYETITDPDLMPLLYQRYQEITDDYTIQFTDLNSVLGANPGAGETIIITLPLNAGFSDKFSCGIVNVGQGQVHFVAEPGVLMDSFEGYYRIFGRYTPVTCTYIGVNRFLLMGSLY